MNGVSTVLEHPWDVTPREARAIQERLRGALVLRDDLGAVRHVAGADVAFEDAGRITRGAVAVLDFPSLEPVDQALARCPTAFPYVPGLLSFREIPALLAAMEQLAIVPDLLLCDGQGTAHPRRFGLACHLGLVTGLPAVGVAKTRLVGEHEEVPDEKGAWVPLTDAGEVIGAVLRTREGVRPVYVSPGHRVCLETAVRFTMACVTRFRLPETTRRADRLAGQK